MFPVLTASLYENRQPGNVYLTNTLSCNTIDTDADGLVSCGTDDDTPDAADFGALALTGDVTSVGLATTVASDAVALGTDTTGGYAGSSTEGGAATTATALAANGANCTAGNYPLGVDASGVVETCTADDDIPDAGEVDDTALAAGAVDGGNLGEIADGSVTSDDLGTDSVSADELNATGVEAELESTLDIAGDVSSTGMASTVIGADKVLESHLKSVDAAVDEDILTYESTTGDFEWLTQNAGTDITADLEEESHCSEHDSTDVDCTGETIIVVDDQHAHTSTTVSGLDVSADINLTAGRSLTLTGDDVAADTETYTDTKCMFWENPVATDDFKSVWISDGYASTATRLWCESDQTVTMMFQVDDGSAADMDTVDLVCISTPDTDTSLDGDATVASGDRVDIAVTSVSGTPTWVSACFTFTRDD